MPKNFSISSEDNPDNNPVVHGLTRRRSEIAGHILHLEDLVAKSKHHPMHIDAVLELWGFESPKERIRPKMVGTAGLFHRGELPRMCVDLIRENANGITSAQLAQQITLNKGWDTEDKRFQAAMVDKITKLLDKLRRKGRVGSTTNADGLSVWSRST